MVVREGVCACGDLGADVGCGACGCRCGRSGREPHGAF